MYRLLLAFYLLPFFSHAQSPVIALVGANIVDVEGGRLLKDQTLIITGNRITYIGKAKTLPAGAVLVDAKGKYLIPGLVDFNAGVLNYEFNKEPALKLMLAYGITTVRDLQPTMSLGFGRQVRTELETGQRMGPKLYLVSHLITTRGRRDKKIVVKTTEEGRAAIDSSVAAGADVIKLDNTLAPEVLKAVVERAHKYNRPVIGGWTTPFTEAAEAGVDAIDHVTDLRRTTTKNRQRYFDFYRGDSNLVVGRQEFYNRLLPSLGTIDTPYFRQTIATLKRHDTWLCLNVNSMPSTVKFELGDTTRRRFRSRRMEEGLRKEKEEIDKTADLERYKEKVDLSEIKWAHDLGLKMVFGSQVYDWRTPGLTLHDGFYWMQAGGFRPVDILRTATINPALFMKRDKEAGSIKEGKLADLVLLDANPLEDISHTRKIHAVIINGKLIDRAGLDNLLQEAAEGFNR